MIVCQNITCTISLSRPKWMFLSHACWRFEIFDTHRDWIIHRFRQHRSILLSCSSLFCYLCVLTIGSWCAENRLLYLSPWNLLRVSCQYPFKALMIFRYLFVYWAKLWLLHYHLWCLATFLTPDIGHFSRQILCMLCHHLRHILNLIVALRFAPNRLHSISVCYCLSAILDLSGGQGRLRREGVWSEISLVSHSLEDTCQVWFVWKWLGRSCVLWQMMLCDALCLESFDRIVQHPTLSQMLQHTWIEIVDLLLNVCIVCLIVNGLWMMSKLRSLHHSWVVILQGLLTTAVDEHMITVWWDAGISWELRVIPRLIYGLQVYWLKLIEPLRLLWIMQHVAASLILTDLQMVARRQRSMRCVLDNLSLYWVWAMTCLMAQNLARRVLSYINLRRHIVWLEANMWVKCVVVVVDHGELFRAMG